MGAEFGFEAVTHENLGETVYLKLADGLVQGRFPPDTRLTIRDLAQSLGTSVTPVRDAILRLIQDDALVQKSAREVRVPLLTPQRYIDIRKIRIRLEGLAAREVALKAGPDDIARLRTLTEENDLAIQEGRWGDALALNQTFHFALVEGADMPVLRGILHRLWLQMGPVIAAVYRKPGHSMIIRQHYRLIEAVEARDSDAAEKAIAADIGDVGDVILAHVEKLNEAAATKARDR